MYFLGFNGLGELLIIFVVLYISCSFEEFAVIWLSDFHLLDILNVLR